MHDCYHIRVESKEVELQSYQALGCRPRWFSGVDAIESLASKIYVFHDLVCDAAIMEIESVPAIFGSWATHSEDPIFVLRLLKSENAFVTSGIEAQLGVKDILIPTHLVAKDFQLIGTIISAILEKVSQAYEMDSTFDYATRFEVLGQAYTLSEFGEYMKLDM